MQPPPSAPADLPGVDDRLIELLYQFGRGNRFSPFVVMCITTAVLWEGLTPALAAVPIALHLFGQAYFERIQDQYREAAPDRDTASWARLYLYGSVLTGLSWGIGGLIWVLNSDYVGQVFACLVVVALATGGLVSRSPHLPTLRAYVLCTMVPAVLVLVLNGTALSITTACLAFVYVATLMTWARDLNNLHIRSIVLSLENSDLVAELSTAKDEADAGRARAEAGERAKTEFLATISHEMRTPLHGMLGMAQVLGKSELDDVQTECVAEIQRSGDMLRTLFTDLFDLAQLENDQVTLEPRSFDAKNLLRQTVDMLARDAVKKGLAVDLELADRLPAQMTGDPERIRQVVLNLLSNAIKFTDQGHIDIRADLEMADDGGDLLVVSITDTGIGIPEDAFPRLFDRFTQVDQSLARKHGGTGLGLAICDRLVRLMGGDIRVESVVGEGSRFAVAIPIEVIVQATVNGPNPSSSARTSSSAQAASELLELEGVAELENTLGWDTVVDILAAYLQGAHDIMSRLASADADGDLGLLARAAHDLKGAASNLGFASLANAAAEVQTAARDGDGNKAFAGAAELRVRLEKEREALTQRFPDLAA